MTAPSEGKAGPGEEAPAGQAPGGPREDRESLPSLTAEEQAIYEWQIWVSDFGERGQRILKDSTVLITRLGGLGGLVAYELAAAGIGRLILAHAGNLAPSDLNRQILMTADWLGKPRIESARRRLLELNPRLEIEAVAENASEENAARLLEKADLVVDCAPLFEERFALNRAAVARKIPLVECAMYDLEASLTTVIPGVTPCVACLYPEKPPAWKRQFPVFGAVAGSVGCMAAMEAVKVLTGMGEPLAGRLLRYDLRHMDFKVMKVARNPACPVCRNAGP